MLIFHNLIHIKRIEEQEVTNSGIIVPESVDRELNKIWKGTVLGVGIGRVLDDGSREQIPLKEGDTILFRMSGWSKMQDGTYFIPFESVYGSV